MNLTPWSIYIYSEPVEVSGQIKEEIGYQKPNRIKVITIGDDEHIIHSVTNLPAELLYVQPWGREVSY